MQKKKIPYYPLKIHLFKIFEKRILCIKLNIFHIKFCYVLRGHNNHLGKLLASSCSDATLPANSSIPSWNACDIQSLAVATRFV